MPATCWSEQGTLHLDHSCELICDPETGFWSRAVKQVPGVGG